MNTPIERIARDALFAAAVVLFCAGFGSGDGDWVLILPEHSYAGAGESGPVEICAKSEKTCTEARIAIREGRFFGQPRDTVSECRPRPGCFSPESNTIKGYSR